MTRKRDHPILFSGEMVRAILSGNKTQTRRIVKPQPDEDGICFETKWGLFFDTSGREYNSPYGCKHHRLWVRETHIPFEVGHVHYRADCESNPKEDKAHGVKWTPSIFMKRWASRLTLNVQSVRVERLQDISEADAKAEGADCIDISSYSDSEIALLDFPVMERANPYRNGFSGLWDSINRDRASWESNPWVWVVEFEAEERNIDA